MMVVCVFKQKTAYEMRISDWSSDVCSSDLAMDAQSHCFRESRADRALLCLQCCMGELSFHDCFLSRNDWSHGRASKSLLRYCSVRTRSPSGLITSTLSPH